MKLPLSWIRDFTEINISCEELAERLTMTGTMVEGISRMHDDIKNVVAAKILTKEKHPNADTLWVCTVDAGGDAPVSVVTGAQNINIGDYIPFAPAGAELPGGVLIKKGKLRGERSDGMMCSFSELGLEAADVPGAEANGILILRGEPKPGEDIKNILGLNEVVFEFEITANRPDCLSVIGIARECAAVLSKPFRLPEPSEVGGGEDAANAVSVAVEEPALCPRYIARVIKNIKIAPSPKWMRDRLKAAGVRPINNLVDITNYVMLEYGQPMHAFDAQLLKGREIRVRRARRGESITTLDSQERELSEDTLLICDGAGPIAIAGIMGGENSQITEDTKTVIFESAAFSRGSVRRSARRLGLRTESSAKFEKGLDPQNTLSAINRACELVEKLGAGEVLKGRVDVDNTVHDERIIKFDAARVNNLLGTKISKAEMVRILKRAGFNVAGDEITVPTFRYDVEGDADIAEEVARIYGFGKIPSTLPSGGGVAGLRTPEQKARQEIKRVLSGLGYFESISYSFTSEKALKRVMAPPPEVRIKNPLGEETSVMRTSLAAGILGVLGQNYNHKASTAQIFEMGKAYFAGDMAKGGMPEEREALALGAYGGYDFYDMKGAIERLFEALNLKGLKFRPAESAGPLHPGRAADIISGGRVIGVFGELHPGVSEDFGIPRGALFAQIDALPLLCSDGGEREYTPLPKFPPAQRDIAVVLDEGVTAQELSEVIKKYAGHLLAELELFDVYKGEQVGAGKKSMAYSALFRASDKTLSDKDVNRAMDKIVKGLERELGAKLR